MKNVNELISIIVPIYKVEKYINRCVDSIISQTYKNLEIILVDDGSPDNCGKICDDYEGKDKRIKVIHKENGGLSDARNEGLNIAKGKWITFVDSDDFIHTNFIERLYAVAKESSCLIVQCKYQRVQSDSDIKDDIKEDAYKIVDKHNILANIDEAYNTAAWNKIYSSKLFNGVRFPKGKIHEDVATTYKLFDKVDEVAVVEDKLYFYFVNECSITKSKIKNNKLDLLDAYLGQIEYFKERKYNSLLKDATNRLVSLFGTLSSYEKSSYEDYREFYSKLKLKYVLLRPKIKSLPLRIDLKILVFLSKKTIWKFKCFHKIKNLIRRKKG